MNEETNKQELTLEQKGKKPSFFNAGEIIAIIFSVLLIAVLLIISIPAASEEEYTKEKPIAAGLVTEIYTQPADPVNGKTISRQDPFSTPYYLYYLEPSATSEEVANVNNIFQFVVPKLHALSDRHNYYGEGAIYPEGYFNEAIASVEIPSEAKIILRTDAASNAIRQSKRINNLRVINESLNKGPVEVSYDLYHLLKISFDLTIKTNSAFSMFIGELSEWWNKQINVNSTPYPALSDPINNETSVEEITTLQSYMPLSEEEIRSTLKFSEQTIDEQTKYYVEFSSEHASEGDLSITLGGGAKGYANDVLKTILTRYELDKGYLFGGGSSIEILGPYFTARENFHLVIGSGAIGRENNHYDDDDAFEVIYSKAPYALSTSGGDQLGKNYYISVGDDVYHRHHIINARTGEPSNFEHVDINILSPNLSSATLDAYTTALMCMSIEDGKAFIENVNASYSLEEGEVALRAVWLSQKRPKAPFMGYATKEYFDFLISFNGITLVKI